MRKTSTTPAPAAATSDEVIQAEPVAQAAEEETNAIIRALDILDDALADHGHTWTAEQHSAYEGAVILARKQQDALKRIANFAIATDEAKGVWHSALNECKVLASDALGA
jgi:hypothetical protein